MKEGADKMGNEELVQLIQDGKGDKKALLSALWENMRGLVFTIARKYSTPESFNDAMQQGFLGLYDAAESYDPTKDVLFSTYSVYWIRQSMTRYKNENTAAVRLPSHIAEKKIRYKQFLARYQAERGQDPDDRTICSFLDMTPADLDGIRVAVQIESAASTDLPVPGTDGLLISDTIRDPADPIESADSRIWNEQLAGVLLPLIEDLETEKAEVIKAHYWQGIPLSEIDRAKRWKPGRANELKTQAFRVLRYGKARRVLLPFLPDRVSPAAMRGTIGRFKRTWTSATEWAALRLCGQQEETP